MKTFTLTKFLGLIGILMICIRPSFAGQLTTQELLKLSIEELMEVKIVKEMTQNCQQIDMSSQLPTLPPKTQRSNRKT